MMLHVSRERKLMQKKARIHGTKSCYSYRYWQDTCLRRFDSAYDGKSEFASRMDIRVSSSGNNTNHQEIKLFVKQQPILSPHICSYTNTGIVSDLKEKLTPEQYKILGSTYFGSLLDMNRCEVQHQLFKLHGFVVRRKS
ncbi:uncharacterized protein LOC107773676 isoform X1 [Nicotiana tabacum]|uniref:Uncharacterized protein LOC107773676 isoform X1 n=1 Tax=Nicotiana tabacum TaxID=4097 RepID=A0AC58UU93_TOBAC